eukprot:5878194-Pyramimonas_sp.AAC.1
MPIGGTLRGGLAMGMGAGCRILGGASFRAGTPIRQHATIARSVPPTDMGACCSFVNYGDAKPTPKPLQRAATR